MTARHKGCNIVPSLRVFRLCLIMLSMTHAELGILCGFTGMVGSRLSGWGAEGNYEEKCVSNCRKARLRARALAVQEGLN